MTAKLALIAALLVTVAGTATAAPGPVASAAKACNPPEYPGSGYYTSLTVKHTGCAVGKSVAEAYTKCRREDGLKGKCHHKVKGYRCTEKRVSITTEFDGSVTCKRGAKVVKHSYQQNT